MTDAIRGADEQLVEMRGRQRRERVVELARLLLPSLLSNTPFTAARCALQYADAFEEEAGEYLETGHLRRT